MMVFHTRTKFQRIWVPGWYALRRSHHMSGMGKTFLFVSPAPSHQAWRFDLNLSVAQQRHLYHWSALATAFNRSAEHEALSFATHKGHSFDIIGDASAGYETLKMRVERDSYRFVQEALSPTRDRKMVQIFDDLSDCICRVADLCDFYRLSHPDDATRDIAGSVCISLNRLVEDLNTNVELYQALLSVVKKGDPVVSTDGVDERVARSFLEDFEKSGIHLQEETRKRFVELNEKMLILGSRLLYSQDTMVSVKAADVPEHLKKWFHPSKNVVHIGSQYHNHPNEELRKFFYTTFLRPNPEQLSILEYFLNARYELAKCVGFPSYAHRALQQMQAGNPSTVKSFLDLLSEAIKPAVTADYQTLLQLKKACLLSDGITKGSETADLTINPWDIQYLSYQARHSALEGWSEHSFAPYLSLGACMDGLNLVCESLFDVSLHCVQPIARELWHPSVYKVEVRTRETEQKGERRELLSFRRKKPPGQLIGTIYCDFFERSYKAQQDCHFTIRGGRELPDGSYQEPSVVLSMNLAEPDNPDRPCFLTPEALRNLFHEFGHALHSMLGRTRYQHVTGTRCSTDFAEVPSILMEFFATDPRILCKFARHVETGRPISEKDAQAISAQNRLFAASDLQQQIFSAALDQAYHGDIASFRSPTATSLSFGKSSTTHSWTTDVLNSVHRRYMPQLPEVPGTAWQTRFTHIVGYGGKYYSYLWCKALATRIWSQCFAEDPLNRSVGRRFARQVLAHGGALPAGELLKNFLGEEPSVQSLVTSLAGSL